MSRLRQTLAELAAREEGAFMPFLVVGDPNLQTSMRLTEALVHAGSDILEFGFAFSDPPADGPTIQAADQRALASGITPEKAFEFLAEVQARFQKPVALLMYFNLILQYGVDAFYARCAEVGVDAVLVADVPLEEGEPIVSAAEKYKVAPIFLVTELSDDARIRRVAKHASGYLYGITALGITGGDAANIASSPLQQTIDRVKKYTEVPVLAGFGISTPAHVQAVLQAGAAGAIVGSALVRQIELHLNDPEQMVQAVSKLATSLKEATRKSVC